jgi:hypothetical protein
MFDGLLTISLAAVALGTIYLCVRTALVAAVFSVRGTATVWRLACCRRVCPDCRRLGERCPWCGDDLRRLGVSALAMFLPVPAWLMMLCGPIEFTSRAKWAAGLWSAVWLGIGLEQLF